jgi:hypothetical protein
MDIIFEHNDRNILVNNINFSCNIFQLSEFEINIDGETYDFEVAEDGDVTLIKPFEDFDYTTKFGKYIKRNLLNYGIDENSDIYKFIISDTDSVSDFNIESFNKKMTGLEEESGISFTMDDKEVNFYFIQKPKGIEDIQVENKTIENLKHLGLSVSDVKDYAIELYYTYSYS